MNARRAAFRLERRALDLIAGVARDGVAGIPGLPAEVRAVIGDVRRTGRLTDSGLRAIHAWRHLLFADGAEQAAVDWLFALRCHTTRLDAWTQAYPHLVAPPPDLVEESIRLDEAALALLTAHPELDRSTEPLPDEA